MKTNLDKFIFWTPRILSILLILFLFSFSFDVFSSDLTMWENLLGFLIHNIPVLILTLVFIISWKYEWVGGVVFILAGLLYMIWVLQLEDIYLWTAFLWSLIIALPALIIGILFLINWFRKYR